MKRLIRTGALLALILASAVGASAEQSKRGFFEGDLAGGGKVILFVQGNRALSTYVFDTAGDQASFGGGPISQSGAFTLTTSNNTVVSGTVEDNFITATLLGQTITANRTPIFGGSDHFAGRFTTRAISSTGSTLDVKIVIDSQNNIFFITRQGTNVLGGFGTITVLPNPSPSPSPSPSPGTSPSPSPSPSASPSPDNSPSPSPSPDDDMDDDEDMDDDDGYSSLSLSDDDDDNSGPGDGDDDDDRRRHDSEDRDEAEDHHEDRNAPVFRATVAVTLVTGEVVTGNLTFSRGFLLGDFTLNGVTYTFRAPQQSSENHLANISTRGFVNTGQGQLIGGFIITGGPKLVLVRAIGPTLANAGVNPALQDPVLQIFSGETLLRENDNWQSAPNANDLIASGIPPLDARESAILMRLEPGFYTAVIRGTNDTTGISLIEVYEIDRD